MSEIALGARRLWKWGRTVDQVWLLVAAIFAALALLAPAQAEISAGFTAEALLRTAPYILGSILIAAYAGASGADNLIAKAFSGRTAAMIMLAAIMGGLSPFCSCGVIPLIAALLAMGVPLSAVMAFWLASPVMDPAMFVLTAGTIDMEFAIAKTIAAIGLGLYGGFLTAWAQNAGWLAEPLRPGIGDGGCGGAKVRDPKPVVWSFWREAPRREKFAAEALKNTLFLGKWLTLAFVLESLMLAWTSPEQVQGLVGGDGWWPILLATLVGVPAYLNGYAALPIVSGLIEQGMAPGAGLTFLVAGGVSSIPAAIAVYALVKRPVFFLYLAFALTGSFAAGILFQALQ
ncbi:MAG: permease [Pseudomonadota bacterium]